MSKVETFLQDVCEHWAAGFTINQISKLFGITSEEVKYIIDRYYANMIFREELY